MQDSNVPNVALAAECLVVVSGLWPTKPLGPKQARMANKIPKEWGDRVKAFLDQKLPASSGRGRKPVPYIATWQKLVVPHPKDDAIAISAIDIPEMSAAYQARLEAIRAYLKDEWRPLKRRTIFGEKLLAPSLSEQQRASGLYWLASEPDLILKGLERGFVRPDQGDTMRANYPELAAVLAALIDAELMTRRTQRKSYVPLYWQERAIRSLIDLPSGGALKEIDTSKKPEAPPKLNIKLKRSPEDLQTKGQELGAS